MAAVAAARNKDAVVACVAVVAFSSAAVDIAADIGSSAEHRAVGCAAAGCTAVGAGTTGLSHSNSTPLKLDLLLACVEVLPLLLFYPRC
jgi:hypothetical protein